MVQIVEKRLVLVEPVVVLLQSREWIIVLIEKEEVGASLDQTPYGWIHSHKDDRFF